MGCKTDAVIWMPQFLKRLSSVSRYATLLSSSRRLRILFRLVSYGSSYYLLLEQRSYPESWRGEDNLCFCPVIRRDEALWFIYRLYYCIFCSVLTSAFQCIGLGIGWHRFNKAIFACTWSPFLLIWQHTMTWQQIFVNSVEMLHSTNILHVYIWYYIERTVKTWFRNCVSEVFCWQ